MPQLAKLFEPGTIGKMSLPNRIILAPLGNAVVSDEGYVTSRIIDYFVERAKGGVGLIIVGGGLRILPEARLLGALSQSTLSARALAEALGMRSKTGALKRTLGEMVAEGLIAYTRPDKPSSRLQKYRLTPAGEKALKERGGGT